jgi:hypothetical protein
MAARGSTGTVAIIICLALFFSAASQAGAWDRQYNFPLKVRTSDLDAASSSLTENRSSFRGGPSEWEAAAGQARRPILCPRRGFTLAMGMRLFFSNLSGGTRVVSKGGEGTYFSLIGHLRLPPEKTQWEFFSYIRMWDRVTLRLEYNPWSWNGAGHSAADGNFGGLLIRRDDDISADLNLTSIIIGGDYDVAFGRDLYFGPNADLYVIKWSERVAKPNGDAVDFTQTLLQPAIGAHARYEPLNMGYFSYFKPYLEGRFSWMSFGSLGLSTWDLGAGISPPISRNVDAGFKIGYKQWRIDGNRNRLFVDVGVEGLYMDFSLQF